MKNKKLSVKELQENLRAIRRRPISEEGIEKLNRIFEIDEEHERANNKRPSRKIAQPPEVDK